VQRTVATVVLEVFLALIGFTDAVLCLVVTIFFCKIMCRVNMAAVGVNSVSTGGTSRQRLIHAPVVATGQTGGQTDGLPTVA